MTARTHLLTLVLLAAATTGALTACGTPVEGVAHGAAATSAAATPPAATPPAAATATDGATAQSGTPGAAAGGAPAASGQGTGSRTGSGPAPAPAPAPAKGTGGSGGSTASGPAIGSFRVVSKPVCAAAGATPKGVTLAWSVTGADGAAIAVDNPGVYGAYGTSYPAKGQDEFPFTCNAAGTTTHTFTVWPAGAKGTSKTLSVSASVDG